MLGIPTGHTDRQHACRQANRQTDRHIHTHGEREKEDGHNCPVGGSNRPHPHSLFAVRMQSDFNQCLHSLLTHVVVLQRSKEVVDEREDVRHREPKLDPANEALHGLNRRGGEGMQGRGGEERGGEERGVL